MEIYSLAAFRNNENKYTEFLRTQKLSAGVYVLPVGGRDLQQPHNQEEIYFVVAGSARFSSGGRDEIVRAGDVLFVSAKEPHRFHEITERLELLVFFAPPESTA